jgi:hypothetical protein
MPAEAGSAHLTIAVSRSRHGIFIQSLGSATREDLVLPDGHPCVP